MSGRVIAACAALIATAFAAPHATAQTRNTLTIGLSTFPGSLHPFTGAELVRNYILSLGQRPLMAHDADWNLVCLLCTTVPTFENGLARAIELGDGKKGVAITVTIRPDAAWGDGTPVTAKDMIFTNTVKKHRGSGAVSGEFDRRILKIEEKDEKTFVLHIDRLTFDYNNLAGYACCPRTSRRRPWRRRANTRSVRPTRRARPIARSGPARIACRSSSPARDAVMVPNETWKGAKPHFKRIVLRVFENTAALEANLLAGGVDFIPGEAGLTLDQVIALEQRHPQRFKYVYKSTTSYSHLDANLEHPALKDRRVRQALLLAADRDSIARQIYGGKVVLAHTSVNHLQWMAVAAVKTYPFDPARRSGCSTKPAGPRSRAASATTRRRAPFVHARRRRRHQDQRADHERARGAVAAGGRRCAHPRGSRRASSSATACSGAGSTGSRSSAGSSRPKACRARSCT
ncbi:MAG: hypothetical protein HC850_18265 [Rhodomicrobium sp.]|nr:hypothetical protein [Rhodomicrobium sp.]